jgi:PAS domain S-box-containing protein
MDQVIEFFEKIFDSSDWPPRWHCGQWSGFHGWLYIISDLLIWSAYFTIPLVILRYISKKQGIRFIRLYFLFAAFILACGATHFLDAAAFWVPMYRLNALFRLITGVVSWVTVFYLVKYLPVIFTLKPQKELEVEIEQRKRSEEKFRGLLEAAPDSIIIANEKGEIVLINQQTEKLFGYTKTELINKPVEILIPGDLHSKHVSDRIRYIANPKVRAMGAGLELYAIRKDGTRFPVEISLSPLVTEEGILISASVRDITDRKKAEEDLNNFNKELLLSRKKIEESEARFRNVIEQAINPILILKGEDLKLELANEPLFKLWNVGKESIGKPFLEILPEMTGQPFLELLMDVLHNGTTHYGNEQPAFFIRENGEKEIVYFNFVYSPYRENDNTISGVIVQATDVSVNVISRKKVETSETNLIIANNRLTETKALLSKLNAELEEKVEARTEAIYKNEKRFRALVENNYDIISLLNESFKIIYRSPSATRILGWSNDEMKDLDGFKNIHPDDRERTGNVIGESMANPGKPINALFRRLHKSGNYVSLQGVITNLLHDENVKALVFNFRDVTEQKAAEEKLIKSEKQFRSTLDNMMEGAQIIDFNWRYIYVNDAFTRHAKYSKEELLGYTVMEKFPGIEQTEIFKIYQRCFNERVPIHLENEFIFPDGSPGWFELSFQPVEEGIFILSVDITERKQAEQKIIKLNTELEERVIRRTEQLKKTNEELEAFSYSVSHDLRAPLRAIIGFTAILEEDYSSKLDVEAMRLTGVIKNNTLKMSNLIDDLLAFSRISRHNIEKTMIDTNEMVQQIITELEKKNETGAIDWVVHSLSNVKGDINTIRQVWINLISNAVKYSANKSQPRIEIRSYFQKDQIVFLIKDNGAGFDNKYAGKLFRVFQRLHSNNEFEGTGVGLAIVEKIVSKHGGKVWAEGEIGKGASFYFSIPAE